MEALRQIIDSNLLDGVISLPEDFKNKKVEITVSLKEENKVKHEKKVMPLIKRSELDALLKGSITESLIGIFPQSDMTLEDYRAERLKKYERTD